MTRADTQLSGEVAALKALVAALGRQVEEHERLLRALLAPAELGPVSVSAGPAPPPNTRPRRAALS